MLIPSLHCNRGQWQWSIDQINSLYNLSFPCFLPLTYTEQTLTSAVTLKDRYPSLPLFFSLHQLPPSSRKMDNAALHLHPCPALLVQRDRRMDGQDFGAVSPLSTVNMYYSCRHLHLGSSNAMSSLAGQDPKPVSGMKWNKHTVRAVGTTYSVPDSLDLTDCWWTGRQLWTKWTPEGCL